MACAARVQVGPARQSFWAVHIRGDAPSGDRLRERTHALARHGAVELVPGRVRIRDAGVLLDLALAEDEGIQARCVHERDGRGAIQAEGFAGGAPERGGCDVVQAGDLAHGAHRLGPGEVWTHKQAGVQARGTLSLGGQEPREVQALAVIDDTAGYHLRHTEWWWSAGVGTGADGTALAWNLVQGINDPVAGSERAVWVAGEPSEPAPVRFAADLSAVIAADGSRLLFTGEVQRRRRENFVIVSSDYTAPFGRFTGALPGGVRLASGLGVMEHHRAKW